MKSLSALGIILLSIFIGYNMPVDDQNLSTEEKTVNEILFNTAKLIQKKYKIYPFGEGAAMPGGIINELNLDFEVRGPYSKNELRKLLIECANELLFQINTNIIIQKFLIRTPFTIENVGIILYNHDKYGRGVRDPEISTAEISEGILVYRTTDPEDTLKFKYGSRESYQEALRALANP